MHSDMKRIKHEEMKCRDKIKENVEKIKINKQLPYLVANVIEVCHVSCAMCVCVIEFVCT